MNSWPQILAELRLQMTTSTFNAWLVGSNLISFENGRLLVGVSNQYAKDWLENRLTTQIKQVAAAVLGDVHEVTFIVATQSKSSTEETAVAIFPGFEPYQSNFTQVPKQFFEIVVPAGPPVVAAFVATVIDQTIGHIVNYHTGERREWWEASYSMISEASGIRSRASIGKAVRLSLQQGYVVRKKLALDFGYRLRRLGEPVDNQLDQKMIQ